MEEFDTGIRITRLKSIRKWLIGLLIIFIIIPIIVGPFILLNIESKIKENLENYADAFLYNFQSITNTQVTNVTLERYEAKILIGIMALFNLIFFGFIAAIIVIWVEIIVLKQTAR